MRGLSEKESEILLLIFKDFTIQYNANSISKKVSMTPRGALKALKHLEQAKLIKGKQLGKAVFYEINFDNIEASNTIEILIYKESLQYPRWVEEFRELAPICSILLLFGSILRNSKKARDIDVLAVYLKKDHERVQKFIWGKNAILPKKIHLIKQTMTDFEKNIKKEFMVDAIRTGVILNAQNKDEYYNGAKQLRRVIEEYGR